MTLDPSNLSRLPLQRHLVVSAYDAFADEADVRAIVLLGSLAAGTGDRVSDADIVVFTRNEFHRTCEAAFARFEAGKDIFHRLDSKDDGPATFRKYLFSDFTSAEIHCIDLAAPFRLSRPFQVLIDKDDVVSGRTTPAPPPKHEDFPVYQNGDEGLIWELFDCIKWLSRGDVDLAKGYLRYLADKL